MSTRSWKFLLLILLLLPSAVAAAGPMLLKGRVVDGNGQPVSGAEVYVFDSANVKRPADFISGMTGLDGLYQLPLPPGRYWTMAIQRQGEARVGPLGPNDRFSGEPLLFEGGADKQVVNDFTITSLKEAALRSHKRNEELVKVTGRILDSAGAPVAGAYAMADVSPKGQFPLYLSTWSEADGLYTLFLPKGKIFLGVSRVFPPESDYHLERAAEFDSDAVGTDMIAPNIKDIPPPNEGR
jgi:hypothetical protein